MDAMPARLVKIYRERLQSAEMWFFRRMLKGTMDREKIERGSSKRSTRDKENYFFKKDRETTIQVCGECWSRDELEHLTETGKIEV